MLHCLDVEPPIITCPKDIQVKMKTAGPAVPVHWPTPSYKDNSEQPVTLFTASVQGSGFRVGRHLVKYEATDQAGNTASCTFVIVVSGRLRGVMRIKALCQWLFHSVGEEFSRETFREITNTTFFTSHKPERSVWLSHFLVLLYVLLLYMLLIFPSLVYTYTPCTTMDIPSTKKC